jgi:glycine/D-amino acid oxidase-like deaminating enzyme
MLKNGLLQSYPALRQDESCDVAIIGAGITGALTAYHFTQEGVATLLLDKRDVATGSTAASTSMLQYAADRELVDLAGRIGEPGAVRSYRLGLEAIGKIETLVRELGDDCGFERRKSLYLASAKSHVAKLRQEFELRRRHGFEVQFLEAKELATRFAFAAPAAILASGDAQVDAFRLTHRLLQCAAKRGLRVFDRTGVEHVETRLDSVVLTTDAGFKVTARSIVFATGYESQRYLKQKTGDLHSTFALMTEPVDPFPAWPDRCLIWETARPYCYLRATADGRIQIGGKDTPYATAHRQDGLIKKKTKQLENRLRRMFPESEIETAYAWAGTFGTTKDGLAYIGPSPEWANAYFALGYGGNGITMSLVAAELLVDHYLGRHNTDAQLFRFDR